MALSGVITKNITGRQYRIEWSAKQSITNNTSTITCVHKLVNDPSFDLYLSSGNVSTCNVGGVEKTFNNPAISTGGGTTHTLGTTVHTITHNSDGTKSVKITGSYNISATLSGVWTPSIVAEATVTLDTIPRTSSFSVSKTTADMGTSVTFTVTRASTAFTHKLVLTWGGKTSNIATGVGTSATWAIPLSLANDLPKNTSSGCYITCITYNGSTEIGRKQISMTLTVPTSVKPSISSVTVSEAASGLATKFGAYIQGKSKLKVVTAASGAYSSTITSYAVKILNKTYTGSTITSDLITSSGSVSVVVTVTDSRGRTASTTKTVTVTAYTDPKITAFTAQRCNSDGTLNDTGEYVKLTFALSITSLSSKNDKSYTIGYKVKGGESFTTLTSGSSYSLNTTYVSTIVFNGDNSYDFLITVKDYFKTVTLAAELSTAFTLMDFHASGTGMAVGKVSENADLFEVALDATFTKALRAKKGIFIEDTRDTNLTPDEYRAKGRGVYFEFKNCSVVSLADTSHDYCTVATFVQWQNTSGGSVKQLLFDDERVWYRYGTSTWSSWKPLLYRMAWQSVSNGVSYKIQDGMCTVRGNSNTTLSISPSGVVACTLPAVARPTVEIFGSLTTKANTCGQVSIGTDGKVTLWNLSAASTYWAFTITYPID